MGFKKNEESISLSAAFYCVRVFQIRTANIGDGIFEKSGVACGAPYRAVIGNSINAITQSILKKNLVDDEDNWRKKNQASPPYLLLLFGPTEEYEEIPRFMIPGDTEVYTYDAFGSARAELKDLEDRGLAQIVTAIAAAFRLESDHSFALKHVSRDVFGLVDNDKVIKDVSFSLSASAVIVGGLADGAAERILNNADELANLLDGKAAKFFYLAQMEDDLLKRFLNFFLAIEVHVHKTFKDIDHRQFLNAIDSNEIADGRIQISAASFFNDGLKQWKNLQDRFIWCAFCRWDSIDQSVIEEFGRLKRVRDRIAHGEITHPSKSDVEKLEKLATTLLAQ